MALFVISWLDREGGLPIRLATRQAHLDYVAAHPGVVKLGGPFLNGEEMAGSMLIVEAENLAAAQAFHDGDPYKLAGLFEASTVRPWRVTVGGLA
ncbi:MAG TPA: YciI family protein [Caulobacter sp.]|nr:YciI family protein [Caulobacter sp.]